MTQTATKENGRTKVEKLSNGLTLIVRENHDVPVATADIWVRIGSADETPEIGGISHFLEHMMFKGTQRFATGQIEREIENVGGQSNAGTSYDFTHYYITLPSANIERGVEMLAEMIGRSQLDPEELEKERLVILEEYRRKWDNPTAVLFEDVYDQLFEDGPYHYSVIGTEDTIRSITRDQMADYYRRHYAPANAVLILTGDVTQDEARAMAEKYFSPDTRAFDPLVPEPVPNKVAAAKCHHRERPTGGELYLAVACAAPPSTELDTIVPLDVAQFILGQGRASVLFRDLKEERGLASTISCHLLNNRHESVFLVWASCKPENRDELVAAIREHLDRFAAEAVSAEQLNRAKRLIRSGHLFSQETTGSMSSELGYYYTLTGSTEFFDGYLDRLDALTSEDVQLAFKDMRERYELIEVSVGPEA